MDHKTTIEFTLECEHGETMEARRAFVEGVIACLRKRQGVVESKQECEDSSGVRQKLVLVIGGDSPAQLRRRYSTITRLLDECETISLRGRVCSLMEMYTDEDG